MSEWWICPWDSQVTVDDASVMGIDCSAIPNNVYLIWWYPHSGQGEILYKHNDRLPIREPFTDFSPYVDLFNKFIVAALNHKTPITLAQAQFVKLRMVEALDPHGNRLEARAAHKNKIAALQTVEEIAAYDIMTGWDDGANSE